MPHAGKQLDFSGKSILCLYEGAAERDVLSLLLENDLLLFSCEDLLTRKLVPRMAVRKIEEEYLSYSHKKPVVILRIIDSRNEKFLLRRVYQGRFEIITVCTCPEIEILLILKNGDYDDYCKTKSTEKPSAYCKRKYGYRKNKDVFRDFFSCDELVQAIRKYSSQNQNTGYTLDDLLKG